mmetsp:Transcript_6709/g.10476  ORF Transcript_6709/g.10476 Transcript_6709/m.10476 type:complete len:132 (-) Transcript_6709:214-609(-)
MSIYVTEKRLSRSEYAKHFHRLLVYVVVLGTKVISSRVIFHCPSDCSSHVALHEPVPLSHVHVSVCSPFAADVIVKRILVAPISFLNALRKVATSAVVFPVKGPPFSIPPLTVTKHSLLYNAAAFEVSSRL